MKGKGIFVGRMLGNGTFHFGDGSLLEPTETELSLSLRFPSDNSLFTVSAKENNKVTVTNGKNGEIQTFQSTDIRVNQNGVLTFQNKDVRTRFGIKFKEETANAAGSLRPIDPNLWQAVLHDIVNNTNQLTTTKIRWNLPIEDG